ncbi:type I-E CRISPR-associated protein Cse1/CasA [Streptomyces griseorubiginosus]|uniref:Type I-E CRISPR-associated protein Cse1/CasA n=1 Tax=Streptomyces griseorubiginosus TaxID=67304 RepID=A0A124HVG7_9ACTN|nr:type I-E CRISPR-associated protein Cse1/CasA [Streptomyces griseorubiginosus]KUN58409.1 type I-E CRISPR-associated protein Cse1/CasA [Streptomyces griseorubiginosus]
MTEPPGEGTAGVPLFDLTSQPWIDVLTDDGRQVQLSLRQVFAQAGTVRRIVGDLPTQEFALIRLLLAITHDALDGPDDLEGWADLWADPQCFIAVGAYLDAHRESFNLLDPVAPFLQTAGLRTAKDEVFSLNRIVADVPNGEPFFTARMPTVERLTFAEAARWVVHAHAYDTSGIKSGAVGDDRVKGGKVYPLGTGWAGGLGGVFAEGDSLRETLLLNLIAADTDTLEFTAGDRPAWRREPCGPSGGERTPIGVRDVYTWQSRRLRLHYDQDGVTGVVLGYGDPLASRNMHRREPMTAWRRSQAQEKKLRQSPIYLPREHDPVRSAWRGVASLVADRAEAGQGAEAAAYLRPGVLEWIARLVTEGELPRGFLIRARVIGASYGTQQSVIDDLVDDHLAMPVLLLHRQERTYARQAIGAAEDADQAVRVLGDLATDLSRAAGSEGEGARAAARDLGFAALENPYRAWLAGLADAGDPFEQRTVWQQSVHELVGRLGDRLIAQAGQAAWQGRTIPAKSGALWLNAGLADRWFRGRLAKALGRSNGSEQSPADGSPPPSDPAMTDPKVPA